MKKSIREKVWLKYDKHCGYCGKNIEYKDLQVDHMTPGLESFDNYMPTCRRCNHYKRWRNLKWFRVLMLDLHTRINDTYIIKVAQDFHMIPEIEPFNGRFYFENYNNQKD